MQKLFNFQVLWVISIDDDNIVNFKGYIITGRAFNKFMYVVSMLLVASRPILIRG